MVAMGLGFSNILEAVVIQIDIRDAGKNILALFIFVMKYDQGKEN
jgi:hypothetical protein